MFRSLVNLFRPRWSKPDNLEKTERPSIARKYKMLHRAMAKGDVDTVARLQTFLNDNGEFVPITLDESWRCAHGYRYKR